MVYADFEYYKNKYFGTLPENSFNQLILKASRKIDTNANTRLTEKVINNLSKEAQEQLKDTACALTDLISRKEQSDSRKLSSFSIDGVSKNFNMVSNNDYQISQKDILKSLPDELTKYV